MIVSSFMFAEETWYILSKSAADGTSHVGPNPLRMGSSVEIFSVELDAGTYTPPQLFAMIKFTRRNTETQVQLAMYKTVRCDKAFLDRNVASKVCVLKVAVAKENKRPKTTCSTPRLPNLFLKNTYTGQCQRYRAYEIFPINTGSFHAKICPKEVTP